jgi:RHS repeat-associated protein
MKTNPTSKMMIVTCCFAVCFAAKATGYYDPRNGRWLSRDPINEIGAQFTRSVLQKVDRHEETNLFTYVQNDPVDKFDPWGLAYFALRPLQGSPWLYGYSQNLISDLLNVEVAHEAVFFEDGKQPSDLGFYDTKGGEVRPDLAGNLGSYRKSDSGWNDCLMRKAAANVPARSYCLLGKGAPKFNCQDWATAVRTEYRRLVKEGGSMCCLTKKEKRK